MSGKGRKKKGADEEDISSNDSDEDAPAPSSASAVSGERRSSGRLRQISKKVSKVDAETRQEVRNARIESLENDNWTQDVVQTGEVEAADDEYKEEDGDEGFSPSAKRKKRSSRDREKGAKKVTGQRLVRNLNKILDELYVQAEEAKGDPSVVNFHTIAAAPSTKPPRLFCSVCGYPSNYKCLRCGMKFCSTKCNETHRDTSCLKFTL